MTEKNKPTYEEARKIVEAEERDNGLASEVDPSSGIVMKASEADPSVLTYDPEDVEYDAEAKKRADKERKAK